MAVNDGLDFPPELYTKPLPLIGLFGLDVQNNSLHKTIWDLFRASQEQSSVNFKLFGPSHYFPPVKAKKTTYEWHIPKGILKRNWMKKRLLEIPSVAALMFDFNWDDVNAEQLKQECVAKLKSLRTALGNHATKIVVILLQKLAPLPEDTKTAEKANSLCAACDIEPKQLFVLFHGDHLQGYISRLESALHDLALNYYYQEILLIKQHKDLLNKTTQQYLFVRHHFKLGFLSELKQDNLSAKKFYDMAYSLLKNVRISDSNIIEVKLIAGFIIYKLCYLMFKLNQPKEAIGTFKMHIEFYKSKIGIKELYFEHLNWLSKQYSAFGNIFNEAVKQGLTAMQTQNPGFYYQSAAQYASERKKAAIELCKNVTSYPSSDPLKRSNSLDFYGQRPWRPGKLSAEPLNGALELEGIAALKYKENLVNHSGIIIHLLGSAISQFKTYKCPRMRLQLVVQMAEEYYYSKEYGQALTLFSHILWDYKDEKWWLLLSTLLIRALSCAYVAANVQDYINFSLEALRPSATFNLERKQKIFNNLVAVLQFKTPEPEPEVPLQSIPQAKKLWETSTRIDQSQSVPIEMSTKSCVEAKARFINSIISVDKPVTVEIYIRSSCPYAIEFSNLSLVITVANHISEFFITSDKNSLRFDSGIVKKLTYDFQCSPSDAGKTLQLSAILLTLGSFKERSAVLKFTTENINNEIPVNRIIDEFQYYRLIISDPIFDKLEILNSAQIKAAESKVKLSLRHDSPALLSEWYPIEINIANEENNVITESVLKVKLQNTDVLTIGQTTQLCVDVKNCIPLTALEIPLQNIEKDGKIKQVIYLRSHRCGERDLEIKFGYKIEKENSSKVKTSVENLVRIPIVQPFEISAQVLSMKFEQIEKCFSKIPFIISLAIRILSPWPLKIHHSTIKPGTFVQFCDENVTSHLAGVILYEGESGVDMFPVRVYECKEQPLALGVFTLQWSRENGEEITSSSVTMPTIICEPTILGIEINIPAHGWVRKPMELEYSLCNHSDDLLQLDLFMESSDAFMFAGQKQALLHLLPGTMKKLKYNLYPLLSGFVALPRLVFRSSNEEFMEQMNSVMDLNLLSHVYVMPQEKLKLNDLASKT